MDFVFLGFVGLGLLMFFWHIADSQEGKAQKHGFRPHNRDE
jgi:hypothetical protein